MIIKTAEFVGSFVRTEACPQHELPEYAFVGRSNVGKSSLINMLTNHNKLAKVSGTPGKTECINYFLINKDDYPWYLVDLPGYGYAKRSKNLRRDWGRMMKHYLAHREQLMYVCQLLDSRIPPQQIDMEFLSWMGEHGIPVVNIFTKADKPKDVKKTMEQTQSKILEMWEEAPMSFVTSSRLRQGKKEVLEFIGATNAEFGG